MPETQTTLPLKGNEFRNEGNVFIIKQYTSNRPNSIVAENWFDDFRFTQHESDSLIFINNKISGTEGPVWLTDQNRGMRATFLFNQFSLNGGGLNAWPIWPMLRYNTFVGNHGDNLLYFNGTQYGSTVNHNNFVGNTTDYDLDLASYYDLDGRWNFWDTTDPLEIRYDHIHDYWTDFVGGEVFFEPYLTTPEQIAPGFLWQASTYPPDPIGRETMTITLDFSTQMNTNVMPSVSFGVVEPFTQNSIENGEWTSATRWIGSYDVEVYTGDGINTIRVTDAEDAQGRELPMDKRFNFTIQTAGTASGVLLEGNAGLGYTHLHWTTSDIDNLAGYVIYRSTNDNTHYEPIVTTLATAYTDTNVTNANLYYYKYAILNTGLEEVAESNEISLLPDDPSLPTTPAVLDAGTITNYFDRLYATWSSQDPETGIVEYQYCISAAIDSCDTISWTSVGLGTEITKTGLNLTDGETYYFRVRAAMVLITGVRLAQAMASQWTNSHRQQFRRFFLIPVFAQKHI